MATEMVEDGGAVVIPNMVVMHPCRNLLTEAQRFDGSLAGVHFINL
jgi:hypothetical protein